MERIGILMKLQQRDRPPRKDVNTMRRMTSTPCLFVAVLVISLSLIHCLNEFTSSKSSELSRSGGTNSMSKFKTQNLTTANATQPDRYRNSFFNFPLVREDEYDSTYSLNPATFEYLNSSQIPHITVFFSPWCHHCQHFVPQFLEIAMKYQNEVNTSTAIGHLRKGPVVFGTVNCVNLRDICMKDVIQFYPTVRVRNFPKGT